MLFKSDWLTIVLLTLVWGVIGAVAFDVFPGAAEAIAICFGWVVSYVALIGLVGTGRTDFSSIAAIMAGCFATFLAFTYAVAVMLGVGGVVP